MKEYLQLLAQRESRVVLGRKWANLWLLVIVLIATFVSIAFSNGSMNYLEEKMNDPFTNWVNIQREYGQEVTLEDIRYALQDEQLSVRYGYKNIQGDCYFSFNYLGKEKSDGSRFEAYLQCRFFEQLNSELMGAILSENNIVKGAFIPVEELENNSMGVIITLDNLIKMGYSEDDLPSYIDHLHLSRGADTLGFRLYEEKFAAAPMPILAVVRRLPQNMDLIASNFWYSQFNNVNTFPLDFNHVEYQRSLFYFVRDDVADFKERVLSLMPDSLKNVSIMQADNVKHMRGWAKGEIQAVYPDVYRNDLPLSLYVETAEKIAKMYPETQVKRLFAYDYSNYNLPDITFLSVNFATLDSIRAFESFVKDKFKIQIEMSQVNSKENFNAVRVMATILSWSMIVFSIVCIILFIVNMLQSYFQKVKRNMGTFKAFGISTLELIETYILIMIVIIAMSVVLALLVTSCVQYGMRFGGILKEGQFDYLSLWSSSTIWLAIGIIFVSTVVTVYVVMSRLLKQTPGDLIYDR